MTVAELQNLFERHANRGYEFAKVGTKTSQRPDVHALNLLDKLVPLGGPMLVGSITNVIFLGVTLSQLAAVVSKEQVIELRRCGVDVDPIENRLVFYV